MFLGTHTPRLDDKGRIALPARFRPELERGVVICKGQDRCLYVYPVAEFERVTAPLRTATVADRGARNFSRILFASAKDDTPDSQGRVTIPPMLRDYAGLAKDCVVNGAMTRIEIWDVQTWQDYLQANEQAFADLSEEVLPEGFQLG